MRTRTLRAAAVFAAAVISLAAPAAESAKKHRPKPVTIPTRITVSLTQGATPTTPHTLTGSLSSSERACFAGRLVRLYRIAPALTPYPSISVVATAVSGADGSFTIQYRARDTNSYDLGVASRPLSSRQHRQRRCGRAYTQRLTLS